MNNEQKITNSKAISIAEMAIVIAIIGLLASIVAGGVKLQKASEIRGFISDVNSYQVSIDSFQQKYSSLPGDMTNAESYWGTYNAISNPAGVVNGNGDEQIARTLISSSVESFRAWEELNLSGFVESGFSGVSSATGNVQGDIGINIPASARPGVGFELAYGNTGVGSRNEIRIGQFTALAEATGNPLTVEEAYTIDKKIDDGLPTSGNVAGASGTSCLSGSAYNVSVTTAKCRLSFKITP